MQLPFLKKTNAPTQPRQYLFALQISPHIVKSAVWSVVNAHPQVLSVGTSSQWDNLSPDSLISAVDESLSDATTHLDPTGKLQPQNVILGLSSDWIDQDKISPVKLSFIKSVASRLMLKPIGFVETTEAILKFIHHTEGVHPTAILLGFWPQYIEITLVRMGKSEITQLIKRSPNVIDDVYEGLSRYAHIDMLPSRMLLYDSGLDLEEVKQVLLSHAWLSPQRKLPFLHFPKIELLPHDFTVRAIALAGGDEVAHALGLGTSEPDPSPVAQPAVSPSDLGFVENTDLQTAEPEPAPTPEAEVGEVYIPLTPAPKRRFAFSVPKPSLSPPRLHLSGLMVGLLILVLASGLFAAYWFLPSAKVTLFITPKDLQDQFELTALSSSTQVDASALTLPSQIKVVKLSTEKSNPTTGTKTIGDKATGSVTVFNSTDSLRHFTSGTTLTSPAGVKFTLDTEISVASASGSLPNLQLGKATAKVTASAIGQDFNLPASTSFRIGTFSQTDISAQNDAAFSGGSSKQVKSVSKDDIASLRTQTSDDLKSQAKDKLLSQVTDDQTIIPESITLATESETFDHKLDDTADSLKLSLSVSARGLVITKADLDKIVEAQLAPSIPASYHLTDHPQTSFTVKKADASSAVFSVHVTASLLPEVNITEVAQKISGKFPESAKDYLKSLPSVARVDFLISPALPSQISTLPHLPGHITIAVQPQK